MSKGKTLRVEGYLEHILLAMERIGRYVTVWIARIFLRARRNRTR